jgi:DNA (cytosine-5)-methyltransferase 1
MKILNLYCGIGGNRKKWEGHEVTGVENDPAIAKIYQDLFPKDTVIIGDAHQYLLDHYQEFDFIWSSPPCPSHSKARFGLGVGSGKVKGIYPDMRLYQEIIFLDKHFKGKFCVENVMAYYKPLIDLRRWGGIGTGQILRFQISKFLKLVIYPNSPRNTVRVRSEFLRQVIMRSCMVLNLMDIEE